MNFIFLFFYEIALWIIAMISFPKMIYAFLVHKKYRKSLLHRFGFHFPVFPPHALPSIWIHAVSVGETKAVAELAKKIKERFREHPLIISSVTETGHGEAKKSLPFADYHVFIPFDFSWVVKKIIKQASPQLIILCESDFWYHFLAYAKKNGASLALVNGKMSARSMSRFRFFSFFSKKLFGLFDLLCLQNCFYQDRFLAVGVDPKKIEVTGNLKLDEKEPLLSQEEILEWKQRLGIHLSQPVLVLGSTHAPEEQLLLNVLKEVWKTIPNLKVLLIPRHPERFKEVENLLDKEGIQWTSFSVLNQSRELSYHSKESEQVILIDAMGILRTCYQLSDIALVAGSFTDRVGGHNILEPCRYGKPVLFGPFMHGQLEFVDLIKGNRAGLQVELNQLQGIIEEWIKNPQEREVIGLNGVRLMEEVTGAVDRTIEALEPLLLSFTSSFVSSSRGFCDREK